MDELFAVAPPTAVLFALLLFVIRFALYSFYFRVQKAKLLFPFTFSNESLLTFAWLLLGSYADPKVSPSLM